MVADFNRYPIAILISARSDPFYSTTVKIFVLLVSDNNSVNKYDPVPGTILKNIHGEEVSSL